MLVHDLITKTIICRTCALIRLLIYVKDNFSYLTVACINIFLFTKLVYFSCWHYAKPLQLSQNFSKFEFYQILCFTYLVLLLKLWYMLKFFLGVHLYCFFILNKSWFMLKCQSLHDDCCFFVFVLVAAPQGKKGWWSLL